MFNVSGLMETLPIMAKGMGGIFIVMMIIYIYVTIQNKILKGR